MRNRYVRTARRRQKMIRIIHNIGVVNQPRIRIYFERIALTTMGLFFKFGVLERIGHLGQTLARDSRILGHRTIFFRCPLTEPFYLFISHFIKLAVSKPPCDFRCKAIGLINDICFIMDKIVNYFTYPFLNNPAHAVALNVPSVDINNIRGDSRIRSDRLITVSIARGFSESRFSCIPNYCPIKPNHLEREEEAYA
jgi:hypothetical protein